MYTVEYAKDPVWADTTGNAIELIVKFVEFPDEMPFNATNYDEMPYGVEIYNRAKAGEFGVVAPYVAPIPTAEQNKRLAVKLLSDTDWASIPDVADPTKSNPYLMNQQDFLNFRSQVREIAVNPVDGFITFPTKPQAQWSN